MKKLLRLFWEMFRIALFVVGGGYAIIAVADEVFAKKLKWTEEGELTDQLPLFQMMPGIMAGHAAVYLGRRTAGFPGSCVALLGVALPSIFIFTAVSMGYGAIPLDNRWLVAAFSGLRASLTGVILAMIIRTWPKSVKGPRAILGCLLATVALALPSVSAMAVIAGAILFGLLRAWAGPVLTGSRRFASWAGLAPLVFLKYGAVAFGGGYVLVPMYLADFVGPDAPYLQIPSEEFANLMALTQMTPGPIGINAATFFGYRLFGIGGAIVTTLCLLIPGFVLLSLALRSLEKFRDNATVKSVLACVKPVTVALMVVACWTFARMSFWTLTDEALIFHPFPVVLAIVTVILMLRKLLGVVKIILGSALASLLAQLIIPS